MYDAQRQGRLTFYMVCQTISSEVQLLKLITSKVSAGEEGIAVGSASALLPDDVIFAQYRETGVFQQRGFTLEDFMSQLFANRKDNGKGRNMPVHYGSSKLNIVRAYLTPLRSCCINNLSAYHLFSPRDPNPPSRRGSLHS